MCLRRNSAAVLILSLISVLPLSAGELLDKISANMGSIRSIKSDFRQEKTLKSFGFPLVITGVMCADHAKNLFAWHVKSPMVYSCIISADKLTQWDSDTGKTVEVSVSRNPALKLLSETLSTLFAGNFPKLLTSFEVTKEANPLELVPRSGSTAAGFISGIAFKFTDDLSQIKEITMNEKSGDVTRISFSNSRLNAPRENFWWKAEQSK